MTQEELREAQRKGRVLTHPEDPQESEEDVEEEEEYISSSQPQYSRYQNEYAAEQEYSPPQRSPSRQEVRSCGVFIKYIIKTANASLVILTVLTTLYDRLNMKMRKLKNIPQEMIHWKKTGTTRQQGRYVLL